MAEDKTEEPTAQRRRQAREEGNIPKTQDLSAWLTVITFVVVGPLSVTWMQETFVDLSRQIGGVVEHPDVGVVGGIMRTGLLGALRAMAPVLLAAMVAGTMGHVVQGGLKVSSKRFKPQWKKLNPATGLKNMVGKHAAWTFAKTLIKLVVFGVVAWKVATGAMDHISAGGQWSLGTLAEIAQSAAFDLLKIIAGTGIVLAGADWFMERKRVNKSLKMTKDEVKRENKQSEGDPHIKSAIRARQREMGRRRMMQAVGESSVVMVNPTHIAVALKYTQGEGAPQVVAKGEGFLAQRIRDEAEARDIPVIRDVIVARTLYKMCEIGHYIPVELYDVIAQILAFVFRLDERGSAAGTFDSPLKEHRIADDELPEDLSDAAIGVRGSAPASAAS